MKHLTSLEENILLSVHYLKDNAYLITIRDYLKEKAGIKLAIGSVFAPLDRLSRKGLLKTVTGKPSPKVGGRKIKYYLLTEKGINALKERQEVINKMWVEFNVKSSEA